MISLKNLIITLTIMMSALNLSQVLAQGAGPSGPASGYSVGVGSQPPNGNQPQPLQPQSDANSPGWPNYAYPQYNNPYYDGGSPGNMVSGAIDWALGFPSSVWDRFSEYLDKNLFPRSPATYGGNPQVQSVAPQADSQLPQNLPPANSYKPDSR